MILFGAAEPRVQAIATLASVASTVVGVPDLEKELRERGYYPFPNARTKQLLPVARHAFEDGERHSIEAAARALACPLFLVHGSADEAVPVSSQDAIAAWHAAPEVLTFDGAGHTFGAVHPFQGPTDALEQAVDAVAAFFRRTLC